MSLNRFQCIGNLGSDPEVKYSQSGTAVANFSVAVNEKWKGKDGQQQERTEWVRCVAFSKTAELCAKYLAKGRQVFVEGRMQTRDYEDKGGVKKYITEIVVDNVQFLGGKGDKRDGGPPPPETEPGAGDPDIPF